MQPSTVTCVSLLSESGAVEVTTSSVDILESTPSASSTMVTTCDIVLTKLFRRASASAAACAAASAAAVSSSLPVLLLSLFVAASDTTKFKSEAALARLLDTSTTSALAILEVSTDLITDVARFVDSLLLGWKLPTVSVTSV